MGIRRRILEIALPSMGASVFYMLYSVVDLMWIGRLGSEAVASVTMALSFYNVNYILNEIFGVASVVMLSRRWGEGNKEEFERIGRQIVAYKFLSGLFLSLLTIPMAPSLMGWLGGGKVPPGDAIAYYRFRALFLPFSFLGGTMMTTFRSIGDTKTLFYISSIWSSVNLILDPVLMFWMKMGIVGSALASGISETAAMIHGFLWAEKKWKVWMLKPARLELFVLKRVFTIGGPSLLDSVNWNLSRMVTVKIFASYGVVAAATFGIFARVVEMAWTVGFALEGAITTLVGQSLGAKDKGRAEEVFKEGVKISLLLGTLISIVVAVFSHPISAFFSSDNSLIDSATAFLRLSSFGFAFMLLMNASYGALVGGGRTIDTLYIGMASNWLFRIPLLLLLSKIGIDYVFLGPAFSSSMAFGSIVGLLIARRRKWLEVEV